MNEVDMNIGITNRKTALDNELLSSTALNGWRLAALASLGLGLALSAPAYAMDAHQLPEGGTVVAGSASMARTGATLNVDQHTDRAVVDWQRFDIGEQATTNFRQPRTESIVVNRADNGAPSQILGTMTANGRVMVLNPSGVLFGPNSKVDVSGIVASTGRIDVDQFMSGADRIQFRDGGSGSVINQGEITVREGGIAAFVAPYVENSGTIRARVGRVSLAAGDSFTLDLYGDQLIELVVNESGQGVTQSGLIEGGTVVLTATTAKDVVDDVINMSGVIRATRVSQDGGKIVLDAGPNGQATVSGELDASGRGAGTRGGQIEVLGDRVTVASGARIDVSGPSGGGEALIGGNYQGSGPQRRARETVVEAGTVITADAIVNGDGGRTIVWSDEVTRFAGSISARGGAEGGDGGLAEVSGRDLRLGGTVDVAAPSGQAGRVLFDPDAFDIDTAEATTLVTALDSGGTVDVSANQTINVLAEINTTSQVSAATLNFDDADNNSDLTVNLQERILLGANQSLTGEATMVNVAATALIQNGIDVAAAGGTVSVAAGIYAEDISIAKSISLLGAQAGVDAKGRSDTGATILVPGTADPSIGLGSLGSQAVISIAASNVTIDGIVIDGDNTALTSGVDLNGADIDVDSGIFATGSSITVQNTVIRNVPGSGLYGYNLGVDNVIANNRFDNITSPSSWGRGIILANNFYADVRGNEINARVGLQTNNFSKTNTGADAQIRDNTFNVTSVGIFHNLFYSNASPFSISGNTLNAVAHANETSRWAGIWLQSMGGSITAAVTDNAISAAALDGSGRRSFAYDASNITSTRADEIVIDGGTVTSVTHGVVATEQTYYGGRVDDLVVRNVAFTDVAHAITVEDAAEITDADGDTHRAGTAHVTIGAGNTFTNVDHELVFSGADSTVGFDGITGVDSVLVRAAGTGTFNTATSSQTDGDTPTVTNASIGRGISALNAGGTVTVEAGTFQEDVTIDRSLTLLSMSGRAATTIQGVGTVGEGGTIYVRDGVDDVQIGAMNQGFTVIGLDADSPGIERAAIYFSGPHTNISVIGNEIVAGGEAGLLTEWGQAINGITIDNNIFSGQTFVGDNPAGEGFSQQFTLANVPRSLVVLNGGSSSGNTGVTFTNNVVSGTAGGLNTDGAEQGNNLVTLDFNDAPGSDPSVISGNSFAGTTARYGVSLRVRGTNSGSVAPTIENNSFDGSGGHHIYTATAAGVTAADLVADNTFVGNTAYAEQSGSVRRTIQAAVGDATAGDTVRALAGTYVEQVTITSGITVAGAGQGNTVIEAPDSLDGVVVPDGFSGSNQAYTVGILGADGAVLRDLTVDGAGRANVQPNGLSGRHNFSGIYLQNANATVTDTTVTNVSDPSFSGNQRGVAILAYNTDDTERTLIISDNTITNYQKNGMALSGDGLTVMVTGNTVTGAGPTSVTAQNGIQISYGAGGEVSGNTVTGAFWTGDTWTASGILAYQNADLTIADNILDGNQTQIFYVGSSDPTITTTISGNTLTNDAVGAVSDGFIGTYGILAYYGDVAILDNAIDTSRDDHGAIEIWEATAQIGRNSISGGVLGVGAGQGSDPGIATTANIFENLITGTTDAAVRVYDGQDGGSITVNRNSFQIAGGLAVDHGGSGILDASGNWWDTMVAQAIADQTSGAVDFSPFLTDGTNGASDGATGFQGDFSGLMVTTLGDQAGATGRIQEAVGLVSSGGDVQVAAGTYSEQVQINTGLTLTGANVGIDPNTGTRNAETIIDGGVRINVGNVTLDGLQIQDGTTGLGEKWGVYLNNNVDGVTVQNVDFARNGSPDGDAYRGVVTSTAGVSNISIANNRFSGWATGIYANPNAAGTIDSNVFDGNNVGMSFDGAGVVVANNTIRNSRVEGIGIGPDGNPTLQGNSFADNPTHLAVYGTVFTDSSADLTAAGNSFDRSVTIDTHAGGQWDPRTTSVFGQIQTALDASGVGGTVTASAGTFEENLTIDKPLSLEGAGGGTPTILRASSGRVVSISGDLGDTESVSLSNLTFEDAAGVGNGADYGLFVHKSTRLAALSVIDSTFSDFDQNGIAIYGDTANNGLSVSSITLSDLSFSNNGWQKLSGGNGAINIYHYNGDATLTNISITDQGGATNGGGNNAAHGIQFRGLGNGDGTGLLAMGTVSLENLSITGNYENAFLRFQRFASVDDLSFQDVVLGGSGSDIVGSWGAALRFDAVGDPSDGVDTVDLGNTHIAGLDSFGVYLEFAPDNDFAHLVADATGMTWEGTALADMSLTELFGVEDQINHSLDYIQHPNATTPGFKGFARVRAGEVFVTQTSGSVQRGVDAASAGDIVNIAPGSYQEEALDRHFDGGDGPYDFGLLVYRDNLTLRGIDAAGNVIDDADDVAATLESLHQVGFGAQHIITGSGVTIQGLGFTPYASGNNKTLEVTSDGFTLRHSVVDNSGNVTAANLYISDFDSVPGAVETFTIEGNRFIAGTSAAAMVVIANAAGVTGDVSGRIIDANTLVGNGIDGTRGVQVQGEIPSIPWQLNQAGAVTVTNNTFSDIDIPVRTIGNLTETLAWNDIFLNNGNVFEGGAVLTYVGDSTEARADMREIAYNGSSSTVPDLRITRTIGSSIDRAMDGDTVRALAGTYEETVRISKSISLLGANAGVNPNTETRGAETNIAPSSGRGIVITADDVTVDGLRLADNTGDIVIAAGESFGGDASNVTLTNTIIENSVGIGLYTISSNTMTNWTVSNNLIDTLTGTTSSGINLWDVDGATITGNVIRNIAYAGIQLDDAGNVTVSNNTIADTNRQGIQVANSIAGSTIDILDNEITRANLDDGTDRGGIRFYGPNGATITASGNVIRQSNNGIAIKDDQALDGGGSISVTQNDLSGNAGFALYNGSSSGALNARFNWFGSDDPTTIAGLIGGAGATDASIFLTSGDNLSNPTGLGVSPGLDGSGNGTDFIAAALDFADAGDTVALDGTAFDEDLDFNKAVGLIGNGATLTSLSLNVGGGTVTGLTAQTVAINAGSVQRGFDATAAGGSTTLAGGVGSGQTLNYSKAVTFAGGGNILGSLFLNDAGGSVTGLTANTVAVNAGSVQRGLGLTASGGATNLSAGTGTGEAVTFNKAVALAGVGNVLGSLSIDVTGGTITGVTAPTVTNNAGGLQRAVDATATGGTLTVNATNGTTDTVSIGKALTMTGTATVASLSTSAPLTIGGLINTAAGGGGVTFGAPLTLASPLTVNTAPSGGTASFGDIAGPGVPLTVTAGTGSVFFNGLAGSAASPLGALTASGNSLTVGGSVFAASANLIFSGDVDLGTNSLHSSGAANINAGNLTGRATGSDVVITASGDVTNIIVEATNSANVSGKSIKGTVTASGTVAISAVELVDALVSGGTVTVVATNGDILGSIVSSGAVTLSAGRNIAAQTVAASITTSAGGDTAINGRKIDVEDTEATVAIVLPEGFSNADLSALAGNLPDELLFNLLAPAAGEGATATQPKLVFVRSTGLVGDVLAENGIAVLDLTAPHNAPLLEAVELSLEELLGTEEAGLKPTTDADTNPSDGA